MSQSFDFRTQHFWLNALTFDSLFFSAFVYLGGIASIKFVLCILVNSGSSSQKRQLNYILASDFHKLLFFDSRDLSSSFRSFFQCLVDVSNGFIVLIIIICH